MVSPSSGIICRICLESTSSEPLIAPCNCTGTMGKVHHSCLLRWLQIKNRDNCEICGFKYIKVNRHQSFLDWLKDPSEQAYRRTFFIDVASFVILMPLVFVGFWMCVVGSYTFSLVRESKWEVAGLSSVATFLLLMWCIWCFVTYKYHVHISNYWRERHQVLQIVGVQKGKGTQRKAQTLAPSEPLDPPILPSEEGQGECFPLHELRQPRPSPHISLSTTTYPSLDSSLYAEASSSTTSLSWVEHWV